MNAEPPNPPVPEGPQGWPVTGSPVPPPVGEPPNYGAPSGATAPGWTPGNAVPPGPLAQPVGPPRPSGHAGPQQPWQGGHPVETPKKSRKGLKIALAVIGLMLLGIGGCSLLVFRTLSAPIDTSNEFLGHLDQGRYAAAEAMVGRCAGDIAPSSEANLEERITDYNLTGAETSSSAGLTTAAVTGSVVLDSDTQPAEIQLQKEDDEWVICRIDIGS